MRNYVLVKYHGGDPVLFKLPETNNKILSGTAFWVNASNDLMNALNGNFGDKVIVNIKSMDETSLKEEQNESEPEGAGV